MKKVSEGEALYKISPEWVPDLFGPVVVYFVYVLETNGLQFWEREKVFDTLFMARFYVWRRLHWKRPKSLKRSSPLLL